jgi:hypothetical protein
MVNTIQTYWPERCRYDQPMRKGILPVLVMFGCLAIAACGSSKSPTVRVLQPAPVNKSTFTAQVSSLCQRANSAFGATKTTKGKVSIITHYLTVFHSVKTPSQLKSLYAQYLGVLSQELAALKRGDSKTLFHLAHTKARPLAIKLGAKGCVT